MSNVKVIDPVIVTGKNGRSSQPRMRVDTMPNSPESPRLSGAVRSVADDVNSSSFSSSYLKSLGVQGANLAFDALGSYIGGTINEHFAKRSEERADKRNRDLLLDQPGITAEGRRMAGLNPYGDAVLPGMSAQSSVDSGNIASSSFVDAQKLTIDEQIALARLQNESLVAESQADKNFAEADATRGKESRDVEMFPVSLYGMRLSNELKEFDYSQAIQKAPLILRQLEKDIEYQEWQIVNAEKDSSIKDETINEKRENVLNLQATRGLIKAQEMLAYSGISLNKAQKALFEEQKGLVNAEKQFTRLQVKDLFETVKANMASGYYKSYSEQSIKRLSYELEKFGRTLWDAPDDSTIWWYLGNALWNIQNCLTLSGSSSISTGSRVVTRGK